MQTRALLSNFSGGELSPRVHGRVDIKKYASGCRIIENAIVVPHGGARKRPGTKFVVRQKNNTDTVQLVYFQYSTEQSYVLVFGPSYVWFIKDQGIITHAAVNITGITQANPAVVTATAHGFSNGDVVLIQSVSGMTELNNRHFVVANAATNTFELTGVNSTGYTAYSAGGTVAEIVNLSTNYAAADVPDLQFAQVNDVMYIAHQDYPLQKLSRLSHTSWTLTEPDIITGPFRTINGDREKRVSCAFSSFSITNVSAADPTVVTAPGHSFVIGSFMGISGVSPAMYDNGTTPLNGNIWEVTGVSGDDVTIAADTSVGSAYTSGGTATVVATRYGTYVVGDAVELTATSATFDPDMVGSLFRLSEDGNAIGIDSPPVGDDQKSLYLGQVYTYEGNVYGVGLTGDVINGVLTPGTGQSWKTIGRVPAHTDGTVQVIGSKPTSGNAAYFESDFLHPGYCIVRITGYTSSTVVDAEIVRYQLPASVAQNGTTFFEEAAWSDYRGYPGAITFFEQRLWLAGSRSEPTVMWASSSGAFESFEDGPDDADALVYRLASGAGDTIRWMSGGRILTAGTSAGEYAIAASNQNEALTPSNIQAKIQTTYGTSEAQPVRINQAVLYPQRSGAVDNPARKLREFAYNFSQDAYSSTDLTIFSEHVTGPGFDQIGYVTDPDSVIWLRRTDGVLPTCTYEREQEVIAWQRQVIAGTDAVVESIAVIPGADGDEVYVSVSREIDGATLKTIEVFGPEFRHDTSKADGIFLDSAVVYSGTSTSTISGLNHLEGETVDVLNNGAVERGKSVIDGRITLDRATTKAIIGLRYQTVIETTDLEAGQRAGTGQSRPKKISKAWLQLLRSLGGTVGCVDDDYAETNQRNIEYRRASHPMDDSPPLFTGLAPVDLDGGWNRNGIIRIEHDDPLPFYVAGIVAEIDTNG